MALACLFSRAPLIYMLHESNEKAVRLHSRNARIGHFICGAMQFARSGASAKTEEEMCNFVSMSTERTNERTPPPNENLPFKSHFGSTYFLSVARRSRRGIASFHPLRKAQTSASYIHFVQRYGLNLCGSFPPFSLTLRR